MSALEIIGPYFFEDERRRTLTVNLERYVEILDDFVVPECKSFLIITKEHLPSKTELGQPYPIFLCHQFERFCVNIIKL